ncbi:MAG TPA: tetratricopeptide repeat protein [Lacunisphaera sp.]|nr:tetratricopeptide repeat protein [Lacunisphaera sp.]
MCWLVSVGLNAASLQVDTSAPALSPVEKLAGEWETRFSREDYIPATPLEKSLHDYFKQVYKTCGMAAGGDLADISRIVGRARAQMAGNTQQVIQEFVDAGYRRADVEVYFDRLYVRLQQDLAAYFGKERKDPAKVQPVSAPVSDELLAKAHRLFMQKDSVGALKALEDALRFAPDNVRLTLDAAIRQQAIGQLAEARQNFDLARGRYPNVVSIYFGMGEIRLVAGDYLGAIEALTTAIYLEPQALRAYSSRGAARQAIDDYEGAIDDFSLHIGSGYPTGLAQVYVFRGWAHLTLGNLEIARADFAAAVRTDPKSYEGHWRLGAALKRLGDPGAALLALDKAVELEPQRPEAYSSRMWIHLKLGDKEAALRDADRVVALENDWSFRHQIRAVLLEVLDQDEKAEIEYREAVALAKEERDMRRWSYASFQLDVFLRRQGRKETEYLEGVLDWPDEWPKRIGMYLSGRISAESLVNAAQQVQNRRERLNQECEANFYVGMALWSAGDRQAGERYLKTAALERYDSNLECTLASKFMQRAQVTAGAGIQLK